MLISADEILGFHPSLLLKMPASPLMAFLCMPHKSLSVPTGRHSPLLDPIYSPLLPSRVLRCDWLMSSKRLAGVQ